MNTYEKQNVGKHIQCLNLKLVTSWCHLHLYVYSKELDILLACHSFKQLKFVWCLWTILTGKNHISRLEKIGKLTLPPLKNIPLTPLAF